MSEAPQGRDGGDGGLVVAEKVPIVTNNRMVLLD